MLENLINELYQTNLPGYKNGILGPMFIIDFLDNSKLILFVEQDNKGKTVLLYNDNSTLILSEVIGIRQGCIPEISDGYIIWESNKGKFRTNGTHIIPA